MGLERELELAVELARLGAETAMGFYEHEPEATRKGDGTWVTEADRAAETAIRARILESFPEHNILGEEEGLTAANGGEARPGAPTWVVDPVDGTNNFMAEIPVWATLVALQIDGESVVGACHAPALGESYDAAQGLGARFNESSIRVSPQARLDGATVMFGRAAGFAEMGLEAPFARLLAGAARTRGFGDFWGHVLVARGAGHVMLEPRLALWDVAALEPILAEAGAGSPPLTGRRGAMASPASRRTDSYTTRS